MSERKLQSVKPRGRLALRTLFLMIIVAAVLVRLFVFLVALFDTRTILLGRVVFDENDKPAAGLKLLAIALGTEDVYACKSDANGKFAFPPLAPQSFYRIVVSDPHWAAPAAEEVFSKTGTVEVPEFRLARGAKIQIRVEGSPTRNELARLRLGPFDSHMGYFRAFFHVPTSKNNTAELRLSPGGHTLEVNGNQQKLIVNEGDDFGSTANVTVARITTSSNSPPKQSHRMPMRCSTPTELTSFFAFWTAIASPKVETARVRGSRRPERR